MDLATPQREGRLGPRQRRTLVASAMVLLLGASLWAWWTLQLWGLPDIGDPFDRREHGKAPGSPEAVVGPYLEALPEGYDSIEKPAKAR